MATRTWTGSAPRRSLRGRRSYLAIGLVVIVGILVLGPTAMLVYGSLRSASPGEVAEWTFRNYQNLVSSRVLPAILNSLIVAVGGTLVAFAFGGTIAWLIARTDLPAKGLWRTTTVIPYFVSPLFGALAWSFIASPSIGVLGMIGIGINVYSLYGIIWVLGLVYAPLFYLLVVDALSRIDSTMEEAARTLGATQARIQAKIILPLALPSIVGAALIVFVHAFEQFGVPGMLGTPAGVMVMSTLVYENISKSPSDFPGAAAVATAMMLMAMAGLLLRNRIVGRRSYIVVGGKSTGRVELIRLGRWRHLAVAFCGVYALLAAVAPYIILIVVSLAQVWGTWNLTFSHWAELFSYGTSVITNTLLVTGVGSVVGVVLGYLVAYSIDRSRDLRRSLGQLSMLPLGLPGIAMGVGFLWLMVRLPEFIYGSLLGLGIAYVTRFLPLAVQSGQGTVGQIAPDLEEAAWTVGARRVRSLRSIMLPLVSPSALNGGLLLFLTMFRELGVSILLYSPASIVMSVSIWLSWTQGYYGRAAAMALLQSAIILLIVILLNVVRRRRGKPTATAVEAADAVV